jgi:hypothetical protein
MAHQRPFQLEEADNPYLVTILGPVANPFRNKGQFTLIPDSIFTIQKRLSLLIEETAIIVCVGARRIHFEVTVCWIPSQENILYFEDGGNRFLRNVDISLPNCITSHLTNCNLHIRHSKDQKSLKDRKLLSVYLYGLKYTLHRLIQWR